MAQPGAIRRENREASMSITVKIGEAKARLSELIAKVEAGEEIVIQRGNEPVARLAPLEDDRRRRTQETIMRIRALRDSGDIKPVTVDEILAWRHEGHKY
jgi:prevent-host-death family protein